MPNDIFKKYPFLELKEDPIDQNYCFIQTVEKIEEYGKYSFKQKRITDKKEKLEKIAQQIIDLIKSTTPDP